MSKSNRRDRALEAGTGMVTAPGSGIGRGQLDYVTKTFCSDRDYVEIQAEAITIDHNRRNLNNSTFVILPQIEK